MSLYRNIVWFTSGLRHYTKNGYEAASKSFDDSFMNTDISNRSYMVTGANSGIGLSACMALAKKGATIHMICRNKEKAEEAKAKLVESTNNEKINIHILDLSKPRKVLEFASDFIESGQPLHVLVNNAGCMIHERKKDQDGIESNFATNTLAVYILTKKLVPVLAKYEDSRVINVSSGGMLVQKLDAEDPQLDKLKKFDGTMVYAQNKRQMVVLMELLAKEYESTGVRFYSMHPGWADTQAVRDSMPDFHAKMKDKLRTEEQGADTVVYLAIAPNLPQDYNGKFFEDRHIINTHLPLAWTKTSPEEENRFQSYIEELLAKLSGPAITATTATSSSTSSAAVSSSSS